MGLGGAKRTHDFGFVKFSEIDHLDHEFHMQNTNMRQLKVIALSKSCSCTEATLSRYSIAPGESASLTMKVRLPKSFQTQQVSAVLTTDDPAHEKIDFTMSFTSVPDVLVEPDRVTVHRSASQQEDATCELRVSLFHGPSTGACEHPVLFNGPNGIRVSRKKQRTEHLARNLDRCVHDLTLTVPGSFARSNSNQNYACSIDFGEDKRALFDLRFGDSGILRTSPARLNFGMIGENPVTLSLAIRVLEVGLGSEQVSFECKDPAIEVGKPQVHGTSLTVDVRLDPRKLRTSFNVGSIDITHHELTVASVPWIAFRRDLHQ